MVGIRYIEVANTYIDNRLVLPTSVETSEKYGLEVKCHNHRNQTTGHQH